MNTSDVVRLFGMSHQLLEADLDRVEKELGIDLGRRSAQTLDKDSEYYPLSPLT